MRYRLAIDTYQWKYHFITKNIIVHCGMKEQYNIDDMTADPLNMLFLYHYPNHLYSIFYHQVGLGTTIGYINNVKYISIMTITSHCKNTCYML